MSKYIEITRCKICPDHFVTDDDDAVCYGVNKTGYPMHPKIGKKDAETFPKWCPLKSLMGTKKTINELRSALEYCVKNAQPSFVQDVARQALKKTEIV